MEEVRKRFVGLKGSLALQLLQCNVFRQKFRENTKNELGVNHNSEC
jgi:hypothetical protein